jgi:hypothetical protein
MLMVGFLQPVVAATVSEKESLRGLSGVVLKPMVFVSTPTKVKEELPLSDLTKEIHRTLQQSGMLLEAQAGDLSGERPFLEIQGAVTQIAANYYAYTIVVELHQQATLMRNSSQPSLVTWSEGTLSTGDIQNFQKRIRLLVQMFIQDYQHVNATRAPAWSLSWTPSDS